MFAYGQTGSTIPSTIFFIDYRDIQGHIDNLVVKWMIIDVGKSNTVWEIFENQSIGTNW